MEVLYQQIQPAPCCRIFSPSLPGTRCAQTPLAEPCEPSPSFGASLHTHCTQRQVLLRSKNIQLTPARFVIGTKGKNITLNCWELSLGFFSSHSWLPARGVEQSQPCTPCPHKPALALATVNEDLLEGIRNSGCFTTVHHTVTGKTELIAKITGGRCPLEWGILNTLYHPMLL